MRKIVLTVMVLSLVGALMGTAALFGNELEGVYRSTTTLFGTVSAWLLAAFLFGLNPPSFIADDKLNKRRKEVKRD